MQPVDEAMGHGTRQQVSSQGLRSRRSAWQVLTFSTPWSRPGQGVVNDSLLVGRVGDRERLVAWQLPVPHISKKTLDVARSTMQRLRWRMSLRS